MKKVLEVENYYKLINHGPCVLITSGNKKIKNVSPVAWITPLNDEPPMVIICVASSHYTAKLINKYKEFVINVPSVDMLKIVNDTGKISGIKSDKFSEFNIEYDFGQKVDTVHLKNCVGFVETKLWFRKDFSGVTLFVGKVVYCEVEKNLYDNYLIPQKAKTVHHIGSNKFFVSSKLIQV